MNIGTNNTFSNVKHLCLTLTCRRAQGSRCRPCPTRSDGSSSRPDCSESSQVTGHSQWLTGMAEPSRTAPDRKPAQSSNIVYDVNLYDIQICV